MSGVVDLSAFTSPDFDVKQWINQALGDRSTVFEQTIGNDGGASESSSNLLQSNDVSSSSGIAQESSLTSVEQDITTLATKLQLHSEQTSQKITHLTDQVIRSMPRIVYDLKLVTDKANAAQQEIQAAQKQLDQNQPTTDETDDSIEKLRLLHICKTRMEDSLYALTEAQNWNQLESQMNQALNNIDS
ncbi:hypothetical protein DM01DRAFT_1330959 [Hesseltinella vesiculosa]|uniref:Conserved oligomeric Golgi complex subunit 7 n=1 Tax=Hesseltinella vesiculosa TaxID=101127 RepID=A0A1X2GYV3_9FUNG|nr:hypothetical protein DM01DRAFT_1330959 [Hesseltinella vesiculosa]